MYLLQWNSAAWYSIWVILVILNLDTYCRAAEIQLSEAGKKQLWPGELRTENATVLAHLASHNLVCIPQLCSGSSSQFFKLSWSANKNPSVCKV